MIEYFRYNQESHDSYNGFLIKWLPSKRDYPDLFKCCAPVAAIIFDNLHTTASCFYPSAKANLRSTEHTEQYISFPFKGFVYCNLYKTAQENINHLPEI